MSRDNYNDGKAIGELIVMLIKLFFYALVYSPIILLAVLLTEELTFLHNGSQKLKILSYILIGYLIYASIFFLKGILMAFKANGKVIWIPIFILCIALTCLLPCYFVYSMALEYLDNSVFWSALISALFAFFVYNKYDFTKDVSPKLTFWSYALGFRLMLNFIPSPIDSTPERGKELI